MTCVEHFECTACAHRRPPPTASKSGPPPAKHFNDRLQMDVFYIKADAGKTPVLHMVDTATRFGAARVLEHEQGADVVQALDRGWFRPYGPPRQLQCDEARCFCGQEVTTFLERHGTVVDVAPGEAHTRLGIVERRHMVLRSAIETYIWRVSTWPLHMKVFGKQLRTSPP